MNIGILGAGHIGSTTAELFAKAGHKVAISHSGDPQALSSLASSLGPNVTAKTAEDAVKFGDVVLIAIPWRDREHLPDAKLFNAKVTIDATNPYSAQGEVIDLGNTSSSEEVLKQIPVANLVKAFNTLHYETLKNESRPSAPMQDRLVLFMAGDDTDAKKTVAQLINDSGFAAVDFGFLKQGGYWMQPESPVYNVPMNFEEAKKRLTDLQP